MPAYFQQFPTLTVDLLKDGRLTLATDISSRPAIAALFKQTRVVYFPYLVKDGERADQIAYRYYQDERLDWLIYLVNNIFDPYFDWPLDSTSFQRYIQQKYGSVSTANATVHHYEWIIQAASTYTTSGGETVLIPERVLVVDGTTYNGLAATARRSVSMYTYEDRLNEGRRKIQLLDKVMVKPILRRFAALYPPTE